MKTMLSVFLMLVVSIATGATAVSTTVTKEAMVVNVGYTDTHFQINLPSNPSTGYQWTVKNYDRTLLRLLSSNYVASDTTSVGGGGMTVFNFEVIPEVKVPNLTSLVFVYARPWEANLGTSKTVTINFQGEAVVK